MQLSSWIGYNNLIDIRTRITDITRVDYHNNSPIVGTKFGRLADATLTSSASEYVSFSLLLRVSNTLVSNVVSPSAGKGALVSFTASPSSSSKVSSLTVIFVAVDLLLGYAFPTANIC